MRYRKLFAIFIVCWFFCGSVAPLLFAAEESQTEHAGSGEHEETLAQTIGKWFNFAVLVAILYLFLNKSIRVQDKFRSDSEEIRRSIESARQAKEEAEQRLLEMDQKMLQMNDEIAKVKETVALEAEEERNKILESAQREAQRIVESAQREIDNEVLHAQKELQRRVADLAVADGKAIIEQEINEDDQKQLIDRYIESFGK